MASRIFSPKMASMMAQTSAKIVRPAAQNGLKFNQRAFTG